MHTPHFSVNSRKRIELKAMTENISGTCHGLMYDSHGVQLTSRRAILSFLSVLVPTVEIA